MKLKTFLETHQKHSHAESLQDNIGDGYLLDQNLIYKNIRNAAKANHIKFSSKRFHDYDVLPLTQLPKILSAKTVPYLPNVNALLEIEAAIPNHFDLNETPPLRANYVLHETAHCLVRMMRVKYLGDFSTETSSISLNAQKKIALMVLVEESFANAAESLLSAYADSSIHDDFLARNTYIFEQPAARKKMKSAIKMIGLDATFRLIFLSFLFANFQKQKISKTEFNRVLTIALMNEPKKRLNLNDSDSNLLRHVFQSGLDLDPMFTFKTNAFCLKFFGITADLKNVFSYDFLMDFEKEIKFQEFLNEMGMVISHGRTL